MKWLVKMVTMSNGEPADTPYSSGAVIEDRREGAHDLIHRANAEWKTTPLAGEVYEIVPIVDARTYRVDGDGSVTQIAHTPVGIDVSYAGEQPTTDGLRGPQ